MDIRLDAFGQEVLLRRGAVRNADRVHMEDMLGVTGDLGRPPTRSGESGGVGRGVRAPRGVPAFEAPQFHSKHRALNSFHPVVVALDFVHVFALLTPVAQHADLGVVSRIVRHNRPRLAVRAEVLTRIEAEAAELADAAHAASFVLRAVGLGGVLDHYQAVAIRDLHDRIHVAGLAVEVNRNDRLRARRDRLFKLTGIEREGRGVNVNENGLRAGVADGRHRCHESERNSDDFVFRSHARREQRKVESAGAGVDAYRILGAAIVGELALEGLNLAPQHELARGDEIQNRRLHFLPYCQILRIQV